MIYIADEVICSKNSIHNMSKIRTRILLTLRGGFIKLDGQLIFLSEFCPHC